MSVTFSYSCLALWAAVGHGLLKGGAMAAIHIPSDCMLQSAHVFETAAALPALHEPQADSEQEHERSAGDVRPGKPGLHDYAEDEGRSLHGE